MINKDLYMMKVADEETTYEHFGGTAYDPAWMPSYMKTTSRYSSYAEPSWTKDPKVLKKHKIYWNTDNYSDSNDSYWIDMDARDAFKDAGENSGIKKVHYMAFPNTSVGWFEGAPAENYELSKKHPFLAKLKGFDAGKYEKFMADIASKNRLGLNKEQTDAYDKDFADRYGKAITPERYLELQKLQFGPEYKKKLKEYVTPWARDYSKQKTAALAEELNPVPKSKRKRSAFQRFVDTLSTNKAKHVAGVAGGISGMITGKELLHSNLTPMRVLGGVGVVGGAALGAKNIYGLYNDYFD